MLVTFALEQKTFSSHWPLLDPLKLVDITTVVASWLLPVPGLTTVMVAQLACISTAGPVAPGSDFFFRGTIFMTENSAKNMRILIMVLRDARGESPDIPKYRFYSIFPKRRIASTKDEQP